MSAVVHVVLRLPPSKNKAKRAAPGRGIVPSQEAIDYYAYVASVMHGRLPLMGDVVCELKIYRPRKTGDLHNWLEIFHDALNGWAYLDDGQVCGYRGIWRYEDPACPRIEATFEGERFATREEAQANRDKKSASSAKRRATSKRNRTAKNTLKLVPSFTKWREHT